MGTLFSLHYILRAPGVFKKFTENSCYKKHAWISNFLTQTYLSILSTNVQQYTHTHIQIYRLNTAKLMTSFFTFKLQGCFIVCYFVL